VSLDSIWWTGADLKRPECVMATAAGDVYCSDARGGVTCVRADGAQEFYGGNVQPVPRPNGIALRKNGNFLFANIAEDGGVFELSRNGDCRKILERVDGIDLPPTNFVCEDRSGRVWVSVSTWRVPRSRAYRREVADGCVILLDHRGASVVADGIGYANEIAVSHDGRSLFVNETFGRRLLRFDVTQSGRLTNRTVVCAFGKGTYPDGLTFDVEGGAWITSIISNRVIRVAPDGGQQVILEDADAAHVDWCESAYEAGTMSREHLEKAAGKVLRNISSLAFGGHDRRNVYLGCLLGDALATFRSPFPGIEPLHWRY
jgi:sugar lactone lactonase YvrE